MKILALSNLYPPDFIGGYELLCQQVVDALRKEGHDLRVLTSVPRCPVPFEPYLLRQFQLSPVYDSALMQRLDVKQRTQYVVQGHFINAHNVYLLLSTLESFQPDVVYLHNLVGLGGLGLLGCLHHMRVPWVWQLGDMVPRQLCSLPNQRTPAMPNVRATDTLPWLVKEFNRQVRGQYIACSQRLVREIEACGLRIHDQTELLTNWVHGMVPPERVDYYHGGHLKIVYAGQMGAYKGVDLLIAAAALLRQQGHEEFSIDIYGRIDSPMWQSLIEKDRLTDKVALKGFLQQRELAQRFGRYDVFAFPTWRREPFGCAPLEAAFSGCVPVLAETCGISEWLVHGVHCLKTERTAPGFARVFGHILSGAINLKPLAQRVAAVARRDFHLDAVLPRIERILAAAARRPRTGGGTSAEVVRLALLADKLAQTLVTESLEAATVSRKAA